MLNRDVKIIFEANLFRTSSTLQILVLKKNVWFSVYLNQNTFHLSRQYKTCNMSCSGLSVWRFIKFHEWPKLNDNFKIRVTFSNVFDAKFLLLRRSFKIFWKINVLKFFKYHLWFFLTALAFWRSQIFSCTLTDFLHWQMASING